MKKILIVSNGPLCRNPRVFKEASTLAAANYDVTVLTVRDHAASEIQDEILMKEARFRRLTVDLLPGFGTARITVFLRRLRLWLARKLGRLPQGQSIHALGPAAALLRAARHQSADLVIVHNEIAHWVGTTLLDEGRRVAADIEDWHSEDLLPAARRQRPLTVIRSVERALLNRATYCTTTSHALASALHARYAGNQPAVLTNSFPLQSNFRSAPPSDPPAFFWFSQTIGPGRGLEEFVSAWTLMRQPSRLVLLGESTVAFARLIRQSVPSERQSRLDFLDLVPANQLPAMIAQYDIGLALEQSWIVNRDLTITNKILQYLNAGLAVVATPTAGQKEVAARAPGAVHFIDLASPVSAAKILDELIGSRGAIVSAQRSARHAAEAIYCWEREEPQLVEIVAEALKCPLP